MPFIYHDPATVTNPKNIIKNVQVLYDGKADGFSLAVLECEGLPHIGIRWNVAIKEQSDRDKQAGNVIADGSPSAKGIPSWFILPRELFNPKLFDKDSKMFLEMVAGYRPEEGK